jgi:hypothetical protein
VTRVLDPAASTINCDWLPDTTGIPLTVIAAAASLEVGMTLNCEVEKGTETL